MFKWPRRLLQDSEKKDGEKPLPFILSAPHESIADLILEVKPTSFAQLKAIAIEHFIKEGFEVGSIQYNCRELDQATYHDIFLAGNSLFIPTKNFEGHDFFVYLRPLAAADASAAPPAAKAAPSATGAGSSMASIMRTGSSYLPAPPPDDEVNEPLTISLPGADDLVLTRWPYSYSALMSAMVEHFGEEPIALIQRSTGRNLTRSSYANLYAGREYFALTLQARPQAAAPSAVAARLGRSLGSRDLLASGAASAPSAVAASRTPLTLREYSPARGGAAAPMVAETPLSNKLKAALMTHINRQYLHSALFDTHLFKNKEHVVHAEQMVKFISTRGITLETLLIAMRQADKLIIGSAKKRGFKRTLDTAMTMVEMALCPSPRISPVSIKARH